MKDGIHGYKEIEEFITSYSMQAANYIEQQDNKGENIFYE